MKKCVAWVPDFPDLGRRRCRAGATRVSGGQRGPWFRACLAGIEALDPTRQWSIRISECDPRGGGQRSSGRQKSRIPQLGEGGVANLHCWKIIWYILYVRNESHIPNLSPANQGFV
jgi:hypothetical protein